ncbi:putative TPR-like repeat [Rhizoctonia solani]|uniref:Signal recognition particle subunit SRP72 n=1 Tax=Rhizoctonia solani TaxID=456999 RepID=A0A8H7IFB1_9AGAM|nr:putative TPR-like repeat [Rhizoctonia solani]
MPSQKPGAAKKTPASTKGGQKPQTGERKGNYNPRRKIHTLDPAASKKPKPAEVRIKQLFASLCAQIDGAHLTNAIKTCDKSKSLLPTKKAYLLYRLHKEKEAKAVVDQAKGKGASDGGFDHLDAQIAYRLGDYSVSKEIYDRILDEGELNAEEQTDINTNLSAVQSHIDFLQSGFYDSLRASGVNVSQLEDAPAPAPPVAANTLSIALVQKDTTNEEATAPAPLKGPRKGRLPKHVVLGVTPMPDPERWIKKRERTYVTFAQGRKGKGKGRKEGATAGYSQGVNVAPAVAGVMEGGGSGSGHVPKSGGGGKGRKKK